jgi:hypothetical protein
MFAASPENGIVPKILIVGKAVGVGLGDADVGVLEGVVVGVLGVPQETTPRMRAIPSSPINNDVLTFFTTFRNIPLLLSFLC